MQSHWGNLPCINTLRQDLAPALTSVSLPHGPGADIIQNALGDAVRLNAHAHGSLDTLRCLVKGPLPCPPEVQICTLLCIAINMPITKYSNGNQTALPIAELRSTLGTVCFRMQNIMANIKATAVFPTLPDTPPYINTRSPNLGAPLPPLGRSQRDGLMVGKGLRWRQAMLQPHQTKTKAANSERFTMRCAGNATGCGP